MKVILLDAVDWGIYAEQCPSNSDFIMVTGMIVGFLVKENDESITLTQQWFFDDGVRGTLTIPKVCITHRTDLALEEKEKVQALVPEPLATFPHQ